MIVGGGHRGRGGSSRRGGVQCVQAYHVKFFLFWLCLALPAPVFATNPLPCPLPCCFHVRSHPHRGLHPGGPPGPPARVLGVRRRRERRVRRRVPGRPRRQRRVRGGAPAEAAQDGGNGQGRERESGGRGRGFGVSWFVRRRLFLPSPPPPQVNAALKEELASIHALEIKKCLTPAQAAAEEAG